MAKAGKYDAILLGGLVGLLATSPKIAEWVFDLLDSSIPKSWLFLGEWSLPIFGVALGLLLGYIAEKSR